MGARLTGAGWGGCAVALVDASKSAEVLKKVKVIVWVLPSLYNFNTRNIYSL